MVGKRDSELAVIVRDKEKEKININGHILEPGPFARSIRYSLFREHLGLTERDNDIDLTDISTDAFYKQVWYSQAAINTTTFEKVSARERL
jgi:phospholipase D1/2